MVEDRPKEAREMLRSPEMRVSSTDVQIRLAEAVAKRECKATTLALRSVLRVALRANPQDIAKASGLIWDASHEEAFLHGVAFVENILEDYIDNLTA